MFGYVLTRGKRVFKKDLDYTLYIYTCNNILLNNYMVKGFNCFVFYVVVYHKF